MALNGVAKDPTIICDEALAFEWCERTNLFYVTDPALNVRRAFPPAIMQECIANAAICYREFRTSRSAEIIQFPSHAASAD